MHEIEIDPDPFTLIEIHPGIFFPFDLNVTLPGTFTVPEITEVNPLRKLPELERVVAEVLGDMTPILAIFRITLFE